MAGVISLAALSYAWAINRDPLEPYYAAAVRSMSMSWHNFFFGSFDPAGTITLDKLPGAFWVQAALVWILGFHTWSVVLPQVLEGVVAVAVLYRAVERLMGPEAGLLAAVVLAASPATVALNRGNISDTAMTLLLVLAANSLTAALMSGRSRHVVMAGIWVGLAFQTKMIEAWMLLPAFGLAYLLGERAGAGRRARQLVAGGLVAAILSLAWMTIVTVVPGPNRPYVDGSAHDSIFDQVFVYNGFGRFGQQTPLQLLAGQGLKLPLTTGPAPSWDRLFQGELGRDTGWLLPAALAVGATGLFTRRRRFYVLWTGWLATMVVVFSVTSTINAYYTAALSPPIAAILAGGVVELKERSAQLRASLGPPRLIAVLVVAGSVGYSIWLSQTAPGPVPAWLWPVAAVLGLAALVMLVTSTGPGRRLVALQTAIAMGTAAILAIPAVACAQLVLDGRGAFDTPFEPAVTAKGLRQLFIATPRLVAATIPALDRLQFGAPYLLAVQTSAVASVFIMVSGQEALPIGGFSGTIPAPSLAQIKADILARKFHLVLAAPSRDPRLVWIESHCQRIGTPVGALQPYFCSRAGVIATR